MGNGCLTRSYAQDVIDSIVDFVRQEQNSGI